VPHEQRTQALVEFANLTQEIPAAAFAYADDGRTIGGIPTNLSSISATDTYSSTMPLDGHEARFSGGPENLGVALSPQAGSGSGMGTVWKDLDDDAETVQVWSFDDIEPEEATAAWNISPDAAGGETEPLRILIRRFDRTELEEPAAPLSDVKPPEADER
jgi:hypothetical protein